MLLFLLEPIGLRLRELCAAIVRMACRANCDPRGGCPMFSESGNCHRTQHSTDTPNSNHRDGRAMRLSTGRSRKIHGMKRIVSEPFEARNSHQLRQSYRHLSKQV
ncbi:MAG: hypothetical protein DMG94_07355 [Acidobacteria bacterium]|nr:MAG: hypothetical protein DMG94_07355 [Acidobacteriota bacterium]